MSLVFGHQVAYSASNDTPERVHTSKNVLKAAAGTRAACSLPVSSQPILRPTHEQYLHTKTTKTSENFRTAAILNYPDMHDND